MQFYGKYIDRDAALVTLAAQERETDLPCPSAGELAAFADNRLKGDQREQVLAHVDACPDCFGIWLELSAEKREKERVQKRFWPGLSAVAGLVAAMLIIVVWYGGMLTKPDMFEKSFQMAETEIAEQAQPSDPAWQFPWEEASHRYGFADSSMLDHDSLAFGAGLWDARQRLGIRDAGATVPAFLRNPQDRDVSLENGWANTSWADFYHLGRQTFLLKAVSVLSLDLPPSFWENQDARFNKLLTAIKSIAAADPRAVQATGPVGKSLDAVRENLASLRLGKDKSGNMREMVKHLNIIIALIGPDQAPVPNTDKG